MPPDTSGGAGTRREVAEAGRFKLICRRHQLGRCACPLRYQAVICWALPSGECVPLCNQCVQTKPRRAASSEAAETGAEREVRPG